MHRAAGEVSQSVAGKLLQLCQALDAGDFVMATHLQARLFKISCCMCVPVAGPGGTF